MLLDQLPRVCWNSQSQAKISDELFNIDQIKHRINIRQNVTKVESRLYIAVVEFKENNMFPRIECTYYV